MTTFMRQLLFRHSLFCPKLSRQVRISVNKPLPEGAVRSLAERLKELNVKDPELDKPIDIGFPSPYKDVGKRKILTNEQRKYLKERKTKELELAARHRKIEIPFEEIQEEWLHSIGAIHIKKIASHYGIFRDLFDNSHFFPWHPMTIQYDSDEDFITPVYYGNLIKPIEAVKKPMVHYEADPKSLWTLVLTNPDCHYEDSSCEYLHWFVGNIPGNQVEKGTEICEYLQPFPARGTGFHRFIFVLYRQNKEIDFSSFQRPKPCFSLKERTFKTLEFYKTCQDFLTPAGLAFFQSDWDESLSDFFHNVLNMKEPIFEYDFPKPYVKPQVWNPHKVAFDDYLDRYRDPKEIEEEVLQMRLRNLNPFEREPPLPKFPLAFEVPKGTPSWLKKQMQYQRLRFGKYRNL